MRLNSVQENQENDDKITSKPTGWNSCEMERKG